MNLPGYLLQVCLCSGLFYMFYLLILNRLTFFTLNRWYLLLSLMVSFVIPGLKIPIVDPAADVVEVQEFVQYKVMPSGTSVNEHSRELVPVTGQIVPEYFNWSEWFLLFYLIVTAIFLVKLIVTVSRFVKKIHETDFETMGNLRVSFNHPSIQNGSFFNYIFIRKNGLNAHEIDQIFNHELIHVKRYHSIDRLLVKIIQAVLWFNPFVYGYAKSIEENHEFEVDQGIGVGADKKDYASLLLHLSIAEKGQFYHSFSKVPLKKRIVMLFNQPTPNMKKIVYVLIVPMVLISCLAFSRFEKKATKNKGVALSKQESLSIDSPKYHQKVAMTAKQKEMNERTKRLNEKLMANPEYQKKLSFMREMADQTIRVKIKDFYVNAKTGKHEGYLASYKNQEIAIGGFYIGKKEFNTIYHVGNEITFTVAVVGVENNGLLKVVPEYVINGDQKTLVMAKTPPNAYPFLYEVNKVRFADGTVTRATSYANGKLHTVDVKTNEGTVLTVNFKADDPDLSSIKIGDDVRFRFVHEQKVTDKRYMINDWVCISKDIKDYGVKNPDLFYKFYTKI